MKKTRIMLVAIVVAGIVLLVTLVGGGVSRAVPQFTRWLASAGAWAPVLFVLGYALGTVALTPGSVLTLAGGALFGLPRGIPLVLAGATLGACAAFLLARHLMRGRATRRFRGDSRFVAIDQNIGQSGFKIVLLLRLSPLVPFNLLNYALGLTAVRFRDYLAGSIGMLPGTVLYVYYGHVIGDVAKLASGVAPLRGPGYYVLLAVGLVATLIATIMVTRLARRALQRKVPGVTE